MSITFHKRWLLSGLAGLAIGVATANAQGPAPIFTKNGSLRLPVQLDERTKAEIAEIKLYVRGPAGAWECVQTSPPTQAAFDYRAPYDGEYRFTFVTVDRRGNANPRNVEATAPHRIVVVDSTPPSIAAEPRTANGETLLQLQIQEVNPDWKSLRAIYMTAEKDWQPLMVASAETPTLFRVPSSAAFQNKVQVSLIDKAGNRTTQEVDLGKPAVVPPSPTKIPLDKGRPDPALFPNESDLKLPSAPTPEVRGVDHSELPKAPKGEMPPIPPLPDIPPIKSPDAPPNLKLPDTPSGIRMPDDIVAPPAKKVPEIPALGDSMKLPDVPNIVPPAINPPSDIAPPPVVPPSRETTSSMKPAESGGKSAPAKDDRWTMDDKTRGSHPVLNTRTCTINYALDGGARLTNRIDFWATADAGRTWTQLKDSSGGVSPAKLTLPADGVFGIRIRPGGGNRPPEPGEEPDCVVEIDTTNPAVNLLPPSLGTDEGMMVLTWTAADTNLLSNSISLFYAMKADGPWQVIVDGYKNEGVYRWTLPAGLNGPVYLRMEAMDRAGNIGRHELPTPVALEVGKQRVKVIGVGPGQ